MSNERKTRIQKRKEKEKERRRNDIIMKALELFISRGYDDTIMEDIALEASLSKGTLYNYFDSKDDLYLAVAARATKRLNDSYEAIDSTSNSDIQSILSKGNATYEFSKKYPKLYKIASEIRKEPVYLNMYKKVLEGASLNRSETEMNIEIQRYQQLIFKPIKEAADKKLIRNDLPPRFLTFTITSLTGGLIDILRNFHTLYESIGINPDDMFELVLEWVMEGLKPKNQD